MSVEDKRVCLNCGAELMGDFCHQCGQSSKVKRLTFFETIQDFFSSSFALEGPLLRTLRFMMINPGLLFREYVTGKRKKYYRPVAFFILLTAIYIIVRSVINYDSFGGNPPPTNVPEARKKFTEAAYFMVRNINNILFFLALSIALFQKIFFGKRYNFTEYLTMAFYMVGIYILLGMLVALISTYIFFIIPQFNLIILFFLLLYYSYSLHRDRSFWALLRYPLVAVLSILGYMAMGYSFSFLVVSLQG